MSRHTIVVSVFVGAFWLTLASILYGDTHDPPPEESQCVQCHTHVKGLIRLSWQVEKLRPKTKRSAETQGEG